jgi:hypothetical protein
MATAGKSGTPEMPSKGAGLSREDRLAAKLRENLHRRKAQARSIDESATALPKGPPKS